MFRFTSGTQASGIACAWCQEEDLVGCVWRCTRCLGYYLCSQCYITDKHSTRHPFFRIQSSNTPQKRWALLFVCVYIHTPAMAILLSTLYLPDRVRVCSRCEGDRLVVRGIFSGAQVTRGADWKWEDQDGMNVLCLMLF